MTGGITRVGGGPKLMCLCALLILAGSLLFACLVPAPSAHVAARAGAKDRASLQTKISDSRLQAKRVTAAIQPRIWPGRAEAVSSAVLQLLTTEASRRNVKLAAFRPRDVQQIEGVTELRFNVHLMGAYPAVRATVATLDAPDSKLALESVQVAAGDGSSDSVTASLAISAYTSTGAPPQITTKGADRG